MMGMVVVFTLILTSAAAQGGTVLHVDDDAPPRGNGVGWNTAYRFLQDALAAAAASGGVVSEIRVAQGAYKPDRDEATPDGAGEREATFQLVNGVALRGGYAGLGAADPDERDVELYMTFLSGDLVGDDGPDFENNDENSYHVLTGSGTDATAILDGVIVTAGNADGSFSQPTGHGGGMYTENGSPTVSECTVFGNFSNGSGGGLYYDEGSPSVTNCLFIGNETGNLADGGGMALVNTSQSSHPLVVACTFIDNTATNAGGGLCIGFSGNASVIDCVFESNTVVGPANATAGGGGAIVFFTDTLFLRCTFRNNRASNFTEKDSASGGALVLVGSTAVVIDSTFHGNCVLDDTFASGGAVKVQGAARFFNCTFTSNRGQLGGAIVDGTPVLTNCLFIGNTAEEGGAIRGGAPTIVNCTFVGNSALGGGTIDAGTATVVNSVLWENNGGSFGGSGTFAVTYSNVQGGMVGMGNIEADPLFMRLPEDGGDGFGDYPWTPEDEAANDDLGDLRLSRASPCLDAADNTAVPADEFDLDDDGNVDEPVPLDLDGNPRFVDDLGAPDTGNPGPPGPIVDMGVYEFQGLCPADLNNDGMIDNMDLAVLLAVFGETDPAGDVNHDGVVNILDLIELLLGLGTPCP